MIPRHAALERFLTEAGWADATRTPLAGDASRRSYQRLSLGAAGAILMDAPRDAEQDVRPFVSLAAEIAARDLSAPEILAADEMDGFLLIEDFGDDTYARHLRRAPEDEPALYAAAADALATLQAAPPPASLPSYREQMPELAALAVDWYAPEAAPHRAALVDAVRAALSHPATVEEALVHRDYHADNLIWLPDRDGARRVGLLDFQDAMRGPREYDLASLIHDPRRPVSDAAGDAARAAWQSATGRDPETVAAGVALCSAQRNLRILGVFARLCLRDGKAHYPDFIPATWRSLMRDLDHPALTGPRDIVRAVLPAPDARRLDAIRARAGTCAGRERAVA